MIHPNKIRIMNLGSIKDSEFIFVRGRAVSIRGRNDKYKSLQTNGVGKSFIKDAVCLALTDQFIREDVTMKDLIMTGSESARIIFSLIDDVRGEVIIDRIYHSNKNKPQEISIRVDGEDYSSRLGSVDNHNNWILTEWLDLTKHELFNFYIISKKFKPFCSMSDEDKKSEILKISRSTAINDAITRMYDEIKENNSAISDLRASNEFVRESIDMLTVQIDNSDPKKQKEALINSYNVMIDDNNKRVEDIKDEIAGLEKSISNISSELKASKSELDIANDSLNKYLKDYDSNVKAFEDRISEYGEDIATSNETKKIINHEIDDYISDSNLEGIKIKTCTSNIRKYELDIESIIICPHCKKEFINNSDITPKEARDLIEKEKKLLAELESGVKDINKKIDDSNLMIDELDSIISELDSSKKADEKALSEFKDREKELRKSVKDEQYSHDLIAKNLNSEKDNIARLVKESDICKDNIIKYERDIKNVKTSKDINIAIDSLKENLKALQDKYDNGVKSIEDITEVSSTVEHWVTYFEQFKVHITNKTIEVIRDLINERLSHSGNPYRVDMKGFTVLSNGEIRGKISVDITSHSNSGKYGKFSEGERGRIDVCMVMVFQDSVNRASKSGGLDLLIIDEKMDAIASKSIGRIIDDISANNRTAIVITQLEDESNNSEEALVVKTQEGYSDILMNY